jgi:peptide/nickel transport system substrate-binding protein
MPGASVGAKPPSWTFRVAVSFGVSAVDPAFFTDLVGAPVYSAVCANLYRYPDAGGARGGRLVAEVAAGPPRLSGNGRTYSFTIRRGFRFNTGVPVRAANFAAAINRDLDPRMNSPAALYLQDVVGANNVTAGKAKTASGVRARGNTLRITLKAPAPDLPARLAMSYFCSIPTATKIDPHGVSPPTAGPYYVAHLDPNTLVLRRNPYYRGHRPRDPTQIVYELSRPLDAIPLEIERGNVDYGVISFLSTQAVAKRYPKQFHVALGANVACLALNNERPLFHDNLPLRQAVNYAIDRKALVAQLAYASRPTDQYLPPAMPGFRDAKIYPLLKPNVPKARALASGHLRSGKAIMYVRNASTTAMARAQIFQYDLAKIGLAVEIRQSPAPGSAGTRGEPFDIVDIGCWFPAYMDPAAILHPSFDGRILRPTGNTNVAYFNDPRFNRRFAAVTRLRGRARYRAYGKLDVDLARSGAPAVAYGVVPQTAFVSQRIGCVRLNPLNGLSLGAVCLKPRSRVTYPSGTTTQTRPAPTAIEETCLPTLIVFTTRCVFGSTLETVPSP